jgi:hypothetical protein
LKIRGMSIVENFLTGVNRSGLDLTLRLTCAAKTVLHLKETTMAFADE